MCNFIKNMWKGIASFILMLLEPISLLPGKLPNLFKWLLVTFVVGSSTIWIPLLIFSLGGESTKATELEGLLTTNFMAFFVLVISERVSVLVSIPGKSEKDNSANIKGIAVVLSIVLILVCNSVYISKQIYTSAPAGWTHWVIIIVAFLLAIYLYSLTTTEWKVPVDNNYAKKEDEEVGELSEKSEKTNKTFDEEKL